MAGTGQATRPHPEPPGAPEGFPSLENAGRLPLARYEFDANYVSRLVEGDRSTEDHFVAYFSEFLALKLRSRLRSREAIEDVRQETFARVFKVLRQQRGIDHPERLGGFVNSVCSNVLFEKYREHNRYTPMSPQADDWPDDRIELDEPLINAERKRLVERVLARLRKRDVELLRMVFLEETDRADACRRLKISPGCLRVVLHRAMARFRKELAGQKPAAAGRLTSQNQLDLMKRQRYSVHYGMGHSDGT
jgi:RNA polymerase sigma-70 factor (ECF subfamily)